MTSTNQKVYNYKGYQYKFDNGNHTLSYPKTGDSYDLKYSFMHISDGSEMPCNYEIEEVIDHWISMSPVKEEIDWSTV